MQCPHVRKRGVLLVNFNYNPIGPITHPRLNQAASSSSMLPIDEATQGHAWCPEQGMFVAPLTVSQIDL
jgi:hypothetical protein